MTSIASASNAQACRHVAVCPFPFSSHQASLLLFSRKIAAAAPDIHVSYFTTESSAAALSVMLPPEGGEHDRIRIWRMDDGLKGESVTLSFSERIRRFMDASGEGLRRSIATAEDEIGVKISCVVSDAFLSYVCPEIAKEKAVKWVAVWTASCSSLMVHMYTDELRTTIKAQGGLEACKYKTLDRCIPGFPSIPIGSLASEVVMDDISSSPVGQMLHQMSSNLPKAAAVAINSIHNLEPAANDTLDSSFGNIFLSTGPFSITLSPPGMVNLNDPEGCLPWLDTHAATSVIYISFGTAFTPSEEEFGDLADAMEEVGVPFLWALPDRFRSWVPEGFVERTGRSGKGKVVTWAPQTLVLGHVALGAHLTHCGWNSVTESIFSGVPLICSARPTADQKFNERHVVDLWGIGVEVGGGKLTRTTVIKAVEMLLLEEEGIAVRDRMREMKKLVEEATVVPQGISVRNLNKFISIIINS